MKQIIITLLLVISTQAKELEVYILTGQSNSLGIIKDGEKAEVKEEKYDKKIKFYWVDRDPRARIVSTSKGKISYLQVQYYDNNSGHAHWGLEITCFRELYKKGKKNIMLIKVSRGGGGNTHWSKGSKDDHMYKAVISAVTEATDLLKKKRTKFKIKGLLYLQGESDGRTSSIADQRAEMLLKNLQKDLPNAQSMKMFIGGIGGFGKLKDLSRAKHEALAKKNKDIYFIKTSDLLQKGQYKDRLHFNNASKHEIGRRFAKAILQAKN